LHRQLLEEVTAERPGYHMQMLQKYRPAYEALARDGFNRTAWLPAGSIVDTREKVRQRTAGAPSLTAP
jgi:hypothetical protein